MRYSVGRRGFSVVHVWKLKDGRIVSFHQHTDTKSVADQTGMTGAAVASA
jgi:ketosteroid isomerase-like protein